jgi:hypothetical protein
LRPAANLRPRRVALELALMAWTSTTKTDPAPGEVASCSAPHGENPAIDISVIVPLVAVRGSLAACLESWTRRQSLDRRRYEVIVVSPGVDADVEKVARASLASCDRIIVEPSHDPYVLYDAGIGAARGGIVLITEAHVAGAGDVLAGLVELFAAGDCAAACCRSVSSANGGYLADIEGALFAEEEETWRAEGHWRRVHERGFAIRRDVYRAAGGFPLQYGGFAGRAFSALLHESGADLRYARHLEIVHHNATDLREVERATRSFAIGQLRYLHGEDADRTDRYFGDSAVAATLEEHRPSLLRTWLRDQVARALRRGRPRPHEMAEAIAIAVELAFGIEAPLAKARLDLELARLKLHARRPLGAAAGVEAYRDFWHGRLVRYYQLQSLAALPDERERQPRDRYDAAQASALIRFHSLEESAGVPFRWSQPLAGIRIRPRGAPCRIELRAAAIGESLRKRRISLYLDGRELRELRFADQGFRVEAPIDWRRVSAGAAHTLAIAIEPMRQDRRLDPRRLGVPFRSLDLS